METDLADNLYKIVVVGDYKVGKSSLISKFCDDFFREGHAATIGIDYKIRTVILPDKSRIRLEIFDTAGLEKFRPIASAYYQNSAGIMIVYDTTDMASFENVQRYSRELKYYIPPDAEILVVGNKADLVNERQVTFEVADAVTSRLNISLFEASAKTGENVEAAFVELAQKIQDKIEIGTFDTDALKVVIDATEKAMASAIIFALAAASLAISQIEGIPVRGNYPWSVILCKYYDNLYEPQRPEYFSNWLFDDRNPGSLARFFRLASNELYSINGSTVHGWITMPYRKQAARYLADKDPHLNILYPSPGAVPLKVYHKIKQLCIETARNEGVILKTNIITVINDDNVAMFCSQEGILLTPQTLATSALAHEMVHSFHVGHSYSDRNVQVFPYSNFGEYDDLFDLMSTSNAYMHRTTYGMSGPGLNGPHLAYLGWLPMDRVVVFGKDGKKAETYKLASLSVPHRESDGVLMIQIPYDRDNRMLMLTVTLRSPDGIDSGVPAPAVLIHRLKEDRGHMFSYLVTNDQSWRHEWYAGEQFIVYLREAHDMSIRVEVVSIDPISKTAQVRVESSFSPTRCLSNEAKRQATENDDVCVHYKEIDKILEENRLAWTHTSLSGKCREGFHKRSTSDDDHVCVPEARAREIRAQNAVWKFYKTFYDQPTWGLNSCEEGSIWRSFDPHDYVCIDKARKEEYDASPTTQWGDCDSDSKRRDAFVGDKACIPKSDSHEYYLDYYHGQYRLQYRKFFNGVDVVD